MPWGVAPTASEIEKIKAESSDMLNGWNACGVIDEDAYSQLWDFYNDLLNRAYEQGLKDAPVDKRHDEHKRTIIVDPVEKWLLNHYEVGNEYQNKVIDALISLYRAEREEE